MEQPESLPVPGVENPARTSLISRMANMFAAPGDVFDEIKHTRTRFADWMVPVLLGCLIGIIYSFVVFSQENILHGIREAQDKEMQKQVDAGKMSRQQADQALEMMQKFTGPAMMKVFGSVAAIVMSFVMTFLVGTVIWLLGNKVFKGDFSFMKAVEITALSGVINLLGGIVAMLVAVLMGNMAITPGPALLVHDFNAANRLHALLAQLNVMTIWWAAVLALGLARVSGSAYWKAAAWTFGVWAVFVALAVVPRWGR